MKSLNNFVLFVSAPATRISHATATARTATASATATTATTSYTAKTTAAARYTGK